MCFYLTLMQQPFPIPDPQLSTDALVVRWVLATMVLCLVGVVYWLMKICVDKDKLFVDSMKDASSQARELAQENIRAYKDLSDAGRKAVDLLAQKIDDHSDKLSGKIDANHRDILDRLDRKRGDS